MSLLKKYHSHLFTMLNIYHHIYYTVGKCYHIWRRQEISSHWIFLFACRFQVFYTVSQPTPEWDGYEGRVSMEMLLEILPPPPSAGDESELLIGVCGPDAFTHHIVR